MKAQGRIKSYVRGDDTITMEVVAVPYGGPFGGRDLEGEFFTKNTDLGNDPYPVDVRVYYDHALQPQIKSTVIGKAYFQENSEEGAIYRLEIDRRRKYVSVVEQLLQDGMLGISTQPLQTTVEIDSKTGEIKSWHVGEVSLTPMPANPNAIIKNGGTDMRGKARDMQDPNAKNAEDQVVESDVENAAEEAVAAQDAETNAKATSETKQRESVAEAMQEILADDDADAESDAALVKMFGLLTEVSTQLKSVNERLEALETQQVTKDDLEQVRDDVADLGTGLQTFAKNVTARLRKAVNVAVDEQTEMSIAERDARGLVRKSAANGQFVSGIPADAPGLN